MMHNKQRKPVSMGAHIGSASIVMIFAVLCLTILAALAFETAEYEHRLAEKSASAAQAYYAADGIAEERYQQIYELLKNDAANASLYEQLEALGVAVKAERDAVILSYTVPIDDTQALRVVLWQEHGILRTEQWKTVSTVQWEYDDSLQVWDGE